MDINAPLYTPLRYFHSVFPYFLPQTPAQQRTPAIQRPLVIQGFSSFLRPSPGYAEGMFYRALRIPCSPAWCRGHAFYGRGSAVAAVL